MLYVQNNLREREQGDRKLFFSGGGGGCGWAWKSCATKYVADFGKYGKVIMKVKNGEYDMDFYLKNIVDDFFGNTKDTDTGTIGPSDSDDGFAYHLHSGQVGTCDDTVGAKPDGSNDVCGGDFTRGHYDSNLGCGGASTARSDGLCVDDNGDEVPKDGYPFAAGVIANSVFLPGGWEVGDLSNANGGPLTVSGGKVTESAHGPCPDCDAEYLNNPSTAERKGEFDTWHSLVLHDGLTGARLLCANFVKV